MLDLHALGTHVHRLRRERGLALADLAATAGVSVSMLSAIERGEKAPTIVVLSKVADGLGLALDRLVGGIDPDPVVLRRAADHETIDEPSGWQRTILTPVVAGVGFEWIRTTLPAGTDVGTYPGYARGSHEFVHVESGDLRLTVDGASHDLGAGDTLYFPAELEHAYANPGSVPCTYSVAALLMRSRAPGRGTSARGSALLVGEAGQ